MAFVDRSLQLARARLLSLSRAGIKYATPGMAAIAGLAAFKHAPGSERYQAAADAVTGAATWGGLALAASYLGIGGLAAGVTLGLAAEQFIYRRVRPFRRLSDLGNRVDRIEMGGSYHDTLTARELRARAIADMSGALIESRRFLGNEARILHR